MNNKEPKRWLTIRQIQNLKSPDRLIFYRYCHAFKVGKETSLYVPEPKNLGSRCCDHFKIVAALQQPFAEQFSINFQFLNCPSVWRYMTCISPLTASTAVHARKSRCVPLNLSLAHLILPVLELAWSRYYPAGTIWCTFIALNRKTNRNWSNYDPNLFY